MADTYETLVYRNQFHRALRIAIITLLICAAILTPVLFLWSQSIQQRQALRETKNIVRNMELLAIQYYGMGEQIADVSRESGMTKSVESDVISYSGAEGDIHLVSWNTRDNCVGSMNYRKGRFLVEYHYDGTTGKGSYTIYWKVHTYDPAT